MSAESVDLKTRFLFFAARVTLDPFPGALVPGER